MFAFATKFSPEAANFEKAVFAGFENAELYLTPTRLMSWRSLSKIARSYDMEYVFHFPTTGKTSAQTCEEIVSLSHDLNCKVVTVHEESLPVANHIAELDSSIRLAVENQKVSFEELDDWMNAHDGITLNIDYLWRETLQNCEFSELHSVVTRLLHNHKHRILNVHLSGYTAAEPKRKPLASSQPLSTALLDTLLQEDYQGFVVVELATDFQQSDQLKNDVEFFHQWRRQKGLSTVVESQGMLGAHSPITESL